jgi:o-succinylbenzoate synthase
MTQTIVSARFLPYRLPLAQSWVSAAGSFTHREGWLLRLETDSGRVGWGDCAPLWEKGTEGPREAVSALTVWCRRLPGYRVPAGLAATATLIRSLMIWPLPSVHAAVEMALLDLAAQEAGLPLARYLSKEDCALEVAVNAALGPAALASAAVCERAVSEGFGVLKFKVGMAPPESELAWLRALPLPQGVRLRLDANGAWNETMATFFLNGCAGLPVEGLEEPLSQPSLPALARLQQLAPFSLALDESWTRWPSEKLLAAPPLRRLVLKPQRMGGLLPTLEIARKARLAGMEVVLTSSLESACGVRATAHLAAALGGKLAHGLATSSWLAEDTGEAPPLAKGRLRLQDTAGLGFSPHPGFS